MIKPTEVESQSKMFLQMPKKPAKKPFPSVLFWCFFFSSTFLGLQQYFTSYGFIWLSFGIAIGVTLPTFIIICCMYTDSKCQTLKLFLLIDNFFVCWLISLLGLGGIVRVFNLIQTSGFDYLVSSFIISVDFLFCIGVYRILFKYAQWRDWQIILNKISLAAIMAMHIDLAANFILSDGTADALKEFAFIYVFGYFSLFYQLFAKFTEIDGTGNLETNYQLVGPEPEEEEQKSNKRETLQVEEVDGTKMAYSQMEKTGIRFK